MSWSAEDVLALATFLDAFAPQKSRTKYVSSIAQNATGHKVALPGTARLVTRNTALPPHSNAINTAVQVATCVMTDRSARHRTRPEHDTSPCDAACRIANIRAVDHRLSRCRAERDTCQPPQSAGGDPRNCHSLIRKVLPWMHDPPPHVAN